MTSSATKPFFEKFYPEIYRRFATEIYEHQMTVMHDVGLYRHLRFKRPDNSFYWFDIITWPGSLVIKGDMGTYVFTRLQDMFEFFGTGDMNPDYWAEKTPSCGRDATIKTYDPQSVRKYIGSYIEDAVAYQESYQEDAAETPEQGAAAVADYRARLSAHVDRELFPAAIDSFVADHSEEEMRDALERFEFEGKRFWSDTREWDLTEYTAQFLWCCLAIPYAIRTYRTTKQEN